MALIPQQNRSRLSILGDKNTGDTFSDSFELYRRIVTELTGNFQSPGAFPRRAIPRLDLEEPELFSTRAENDLFVWKVSPTLFSYFILGFNGKRALRLINALFEVNLAN